MQKHEKGVMMLEALIAILIFSLGVLGIVGIQASAIAASRDAKYRTDAGLLANGLIGQMWSGDRDCATLKTNFRGDGDDATYTAVVDGPEFTAWLQNVEATLPGVVTNPPVVIVGTCSSAISGVPNPFTVSVTMNWQAPNSSAHNYVIQTLIAPSN